MSKEKTACSSGGDPFSLMGTGLIPSLVQVEDIGLDIRKRDRSTTSEPDASTEIIESEDDVNLEPDSTTKEETRQEQRGFHRISTGQNVFEKMLWKEIKEIHLQ